MPLIDKLRHYAAEPPVGLQPGDPLWYKDAVIYELNVRAFCDGNGDGIGDFAGLAGKLDYLKDLGVNALWLLPFYPSPLRDDGYDISDYAAVHPIYGTLADFKAFLDGARRRGLRVITEVVLNHSSDQHPWFQRARRAPPGSPWRDFYVWSENPAKYREARVIFKDFEQSNWTWDASAKAYFWHRFYSHQPDLNYDNPEVRQAMLSVVDFWLGLGVDGLRLDAVPYLFEREGTSCENLPETHAFLKDLRRHVDERFPERMLLAEANQWPEDAVAYFGDGDECHMAFHFPLMPRLFMALQTEDRFPILDILEQTPALPASGQWALFLRNHDELTLEMVTDEERDYMYRMYADDPQARVNLGIRRRLAPLLRNDRRKLELMNGLLFSLPGTPVIYYGDEIGMGDNFYLGDRNAVRTPMQWSADRNAGFSQANPQKLYLPVIIDPEYHYEAFSVEVSQNNPQSLLWWMKRLIALRKSGHVFGRGSLELLLSDNQKVLSFVRAYEDEQILVVANLSRFVQHVELGLGAFAGKTLVEVLGRAQFPPITDRPYPLTLGAYDFYWFSIEPGPSADSASVDGLVRLETPPSSGSWKRLFQMPAKPAVEKALLSYLKRIRALPETPRAAWIVEAFPVSSAGFLALLSVQVGEGSQPVLAALCCVTGSRAADLRRLLPQCTVAVFRRDEEGALCDGIVDKEFAEAVLALCAGAGRVRGFSGTIAADATEALRRDWSPGGSEEPGLSWDQDGNEIVSYGKFEIKLFRRVDPGPHPELEIGRYLALKNGARLAPALVGTLELLRGKEPPIALGAVYAAAAAEGYAWKHSLDALVNYFETVLVQGLKGTAPPGLGLELTALVDQEVPALAQKLIGPYLREAELMGERVAEFHAAVSAEQEAPEFVPEPFTWQYQRSLYHSMRALTRKTCEALAKKLPDFPEDAREEARRFLSLEPAALSLFRAVYQANISAQRTRLHGDLGLRRLIYTGKDFLITGFGGGRRGSVDSRRIKHSPLRDAASLLRSFHDVAFTALFGRESAGVVRPEDVVPLEEWARYWVAWVCAAFLRSYLGAARDAAFLPASKEQIALLINTHLRERAIEDLGQELKERPEWAAIPLKGLSRLFETAGYVP